MNPSGKVQFVYVVGDTLPAEIDDSTIYVVGTEKKSIYVGENFIVSDLTSDFETLRTYIQNYLGSEDFIADIKTALQQMVDAGAFDDLIAPVVQQALPGVVADQIDDAVASQIAAPVSDWLEDHVDPSGQCVTDDTLSIRGAAADSKAAGDAIADIVKVSETAPSSDFNRIWIVDDEVGEVEVPTMDEFTSLKSALSDLEDAVFTDNKPTFAWEIGSIGSNGLDQSSTTAIRTESDVYYRTDGTLTIGTDDANVQFAVAYYEWHEASQTYIARGRTSWGTTPYTETTYEYIRVAMRWSDQRTVEDTSLSSHLVMSGMMISNIDTLDDEVDALDERIDALEDFESEIYVKYVNTFDTEDADVTDGYYISDLGTLIAYEGQTVSGYIDDLSPKMCVLYDSGANGTVAGFDENKTFISILNSTVDDGVEYFDVPSSVKYVRFNMRTNAKDNAMLVKGETYPSFYVAYNSPYKQIGSGIRLSDKMVEEVRDMSTTNKLYGKSIAITGDSIAYGAGYVGGYGKIIAERNNMTVQNIAVAGATITDTTSIQPTNVCIADTVANLNAYDYILLEGGVNDASYQVTVGEYNRIRNIPNNPSTLYQYLDKMFGTAIKLFHDKKIGFVIVHAPVYKFSCTDDSAYYEAIVKSCNKWGIPYCDLNKECPPFGLFSAEGNPDLYALRAVYTKDGDGWHPNEDGYKTFYCDKIEAFLNSL